MLSLRNANLLIYSLKTGERCLWAQDHELNITMVINIITIHHGTITTGYKTRSRKLKTVPRDRARGIIGFSGGEPNLQSLNFLILLPGYYQIGLVISQLYSWLRGIELN